MNQADQQITGEISERFRIAGRKLAQASEATVVVDLAAILNGFLTPVFRAETGSATDNLGAISPTFGIVIHNWHVLDKTAVSHPVPAENLACVIDAAATLTLDSFRHAHRRISDAKALIKTSTPQTTNGPLTNATFGIIFAVSSTESLTTEAPQVAGESMTTFVEAIFNRLSCFVEEVTVHCLQSRLQKPISFREIPLSERKPELATRFQVTIAVGGNLAWQIQPHNLVFDAA